MCIHVSVCAISLSLFLIGHKQHNNCGIGNHLPLFPLLWTSNAYWRYKFTAYTRLYHI